MCARLFFSMVTIVEHMLQGADPMRRWRRVSKRNENTMTALLNKMSRLVVVCAMSLFFWETGCEKALGHPHVFIDQRIEIVFDEKGLAGFKLEWEFDEMFSSMITGDYDKNRNRHLEPDEIATIKKEAFSYLSNYDYFVFVEIDGTPFQVRFVKDFSAALTKNKLTYTFFVPCHVAARPDYRHIVVATFDPSYYTAIFFAEDRPTALTNAAPFEVKSVIREDETASIDYGTVKSRALFLDFRKKR